MLATRLATGLTLVAAFLAVLCLDEFLAPWYPLWFAAAVFSVLACSRELIGLLGRTSVSPLPGPVYAGVLILLASHWVPHVADELSRGMATPGVEIPHDPLGPVSVMAWPLWAFVAVVMATFVAQARRFRRGEPAMAPVAGTILAIAYVGLLGGFIIQLRWLEGRFHGLLALACLVGASKGSDTGAYFLGRIAGRHKLWPELSPNKTIEGAIGGLAGGIGFVLLITLIARLVFGLPTLSWGGAVGFGLVVGLAAQLGDLMESMIKRDCERKDASDIVPGFGGVLDVLDSLLFAAPVAYGFWVWFGP